MIAQYSFVREGGFKRESIEVFVALLAMEIHPLSRRRLFYLTVVHFQNPCHTFTTSASGVHTLSLLQKKPLRPCPTDGQFSVAQHG